MKKVTPGQCYGRWTVVDDFLCTPKGEKKWLCRCICGTERYVLERSLLYGGSSSCGCMRRENLLKSISHDLTGAVFGDLTVISKADVQPQNGGVWWRCRCGCGAMYEVPGTLLVTGRRRHCGGKAHEKKYAYTDIAGRRFGRLVAIERVKEIVGEANAVWRCRCDCGNEVNVSYNALVYANQISCGCKKKEHSKQLGALQTRVSGTSLDIIKSQKVPKDNTTGYRGVYLIKGRYVAKIAFQKRVYYLGSFEDIEDAHQARLEAEEILFRSTEEYYEQWKEKAEKDPQWGIDNPVQVFVSKINEQLNICFLPEL